ncbi:MAG: lipid-A-disaccharide synthase [Gemmatimonadetes bacterium]|nr:lipid-A-disaccharide synthase [Gemmatimonadota bacterium]
MSPPTILILAGDPSGDVHAAAVVRALRERLPDVRLIGLGGPRLAAEGVELLADLDRLAVMGIVEIIPRLVFFRWLERRLRSLLDGVVVDLVLAVDYPGLNLRMARHARRRGVPVLYYIAPKVWAWRAGRTRRLARDADRIAVIFPFEAEPLRAAGADARFVGNPLLEAREPVLGRAALVGALGLDPGRPLLALLPGSRRHEVARHLDLFVEAARRIVRARPDLQPVLARAGSVPAAALARAGLPVTTETRALLHHAAGAIVKSGTGTLEAALEGVPFVVAYRVHPLTAAIGRRLIRVPYVALPNLIAGKVVVPELLQEAATPQRLAATLLPLLDPASAERARMLSELSGVRGLLGTPGASARVAEMAVELLRS